MVCPEAFGRIVIIPAEDVFRAFSSTLTVFQLTFPIDEPKLTLVRKYDWWKYEDNWEFFAPRL
jgi:hypothetical protein